MNFSGLNKTTLLDYPGHLACLIFVSGCNFRCHYCHNSSLVLNESKNRYSEEYMLDFLEKRKNILEGVCISGGEPTLYNDLKDFISKIKEKTNLKVKLDTNGTNPTLLKTLIDKKLIDYVAMDIKSDVKNYNKVINVKNALSLDKIKESVNILKENKIDYEFRTTIVKGLHDFNDFENIGKWLKGCSNYYLQNYKDSGDILYKRNNLDLSLSSFNELEVIKIKEILIKYIDNVYMR